MSEAFVDGAFCFGSKIEMRDLKFVESEKVDGEVDFSIEVAHEFCVW